MSSDTNVALGLTEFVAKLIEETFNAIALSAQEQAERDAKFTAAVNLTLDEFIDKHISDVEIDLKLEELFPSYTGKTGHAVYVGAPYSAGDDAQGEEPPVLAGLGLELAAGDYRGGMLTEQGVAKIRAATKSVTGQSLYEAFRKMVGRGVPRVVVDKGRILTRLTFETHDLGATGTGTTAESINAAATRTTAAVSRVPRFMFTKSPSNLLSISTANLQRLSGIRLAVAPATKDEQPSDTRSSVYGEVEIQFRTVSD